MKMLITVTALAYRLCRYRYGRGIFFENRVDGKADDANQRAHDELDDVDTSDIQQTNRAFPTSLMTAIQSTNR